MASSIDTGEMTAAERLQKKHEAEAHKVSMEEVPDEDALAHPPPAASTDAPPASKAAGKQPVRDAPPAASNKPALDTQSEELFPALGAPKLAPTAAPSMWSKKPATVGKAANGVSGTAVNGTAATDASSRTSTPVSRTATPGSTVASQRGPTPQMTLPGRYSESIQLHPSMMTPRNQLKKPVADILRDINKRSKATVEMKLGQSGNVIFTGTGPVDAVRVALKEVATQLCSKQNIKVPIPASTRGRIVGKQGATIQAISKKTGAKINISKQEAAEILDDDDMDATVDVVIEGDPFAVQMAKQDIEKIVNEHTSSANTRLKHVPAEFYPFLRAPYNQRLNALQQERDLKMQIPQYSNWSQQPPQNSASRGPLSFAPQAGLPIQISGDRQAVAEARAEIDRQIQQLQQQLTLEQMNVERGKHQFITGGRGFSLDDFLQETGCSIILPPPHEDTEDITIVGPADKIQQAMDKIIEISASMFSANADVSRSHPSAPRGGQAHAADIARYLRQRRAFEEIERQHDASIVPERNGAWQIYARDPKAAEKVRQDVIKLAQGHPPSRFRPLQVDPFYHQHLREQASRSVRDQHGVHLLIPDESEDAPVLLVFEDRVPSPEYQPARGAPSQQDVQAFEQALKAAEQEILGLVGSNQNIVSHDMEAPVKFHDKIRRHVDRHHQSLPEGRIPVQTTFGGPTQQRRAAPAPNVSLRGPQNDVDALVQILNAFIEQEHQDELERGFTLNFDFPQQYANHLIGRKGENINRLREEFDVDIQLNDGKCEVKGPEAKANACKKHILDLAKKLEDESTHHLHVPAQFHRDLIGAQGAQVNKLQERYGVRINFPRSKANDDENGEEVRKNNQQPNEVVIKGPSRGADAARDEILSLLQYIKDTSYTATVSVAQNQLPSLIGAGGKEMDALRTETLAQIDVPNARDAASPDGRAEIKIKGSKQAVEKAKKMIEEKAKVFDNTVVRNLDVDRKHHRLIIGPQGTNLRNMIVKAGGPEDQRLHNRMIRFPKTDVDGNSIRIEGQKPVVDNICAAIEALVADQESQTTEIAEVKPDKHRLLIGRGGETRRQLEQQFSVAINIPRQSETGPQRSQIKISGKPENVEKAKAHILELTKDLEGETVSVPKKFHHIIADNGQFFRRLRSDHKVTVDHNGQRPPPKPAAPTPNRSGATPLITDEPGSGDNAHSWEVHNLHSSSEEGDIPWLLSGPSPEAVQAAKDRLTRALEEAKSQDTVGFLILPDSRAYRHVIGPGGAEINRIRKESGAKIQVPRNNEGEAIELTGSKDGVEKARDLILEVVQNNA
ncbi:related to RNA binding effector Scp160 [Lecanosticta acicola]|uniref:Related to RNA binding effector Scp160 n=1 Tax=Lecanosticta acicola TaxID=111012 RepID=A0AAI8Z2K0_9PEZI|nr:related to RNA binding effector Scp160 [Lecanosticta acicola]